MNKWIVATMLTIAFVVGASMQFRPAVGESLPEPRVGRYQLAVLPKAANEVGAAAMILDTATGDVWRWFQGGGFGGTSPGAGIIYEGRAASTAQPGEFIVRHGFGEKSR